MVLATASLHKRQGGNLDLSRANGIGDCPPIGYLYPERLFSPAEAILLKELLCQVFDGRLSKRSERTGHPWGNVLVAILGNQDMERWRIDRSKNSTSEQVQEADEDKHSLEDWLCRDRS